MSTSYQHPPYLTCKYCRKFFTKHCDLVEHVNNYHGLAKELETSQGYLCPEDEDEDESNGYETSASEGEPFPISTYSSTSQVPSNVVQSRPTQASIFQFIKIMNQTHLKKLSPSRQVAESKHARVPYMFVNTPVPNVRGSNASDKALNLSYKGSRLQRSVSLNDIIRSNVTGSSRIGACMQFLNSSSLKDQEKDPLDLNNFTPEYMDPDMSLDEESNITIPHATLIVNNRNNQNGYELIEPDSSQSDYEQCFDTKELEEIYNDVDVVEENELNCNSLSESDDDDLNDIDLDLTESYEKVLELMNCNGGDNGQDEDIDVENFDSDDEEDFDLAIKNLTEFGQLLQEKISKRAKEMPRINSYGWESSSSTSTIEASATRHARSARKHKATGVSSVPYSSYNRNNEAQFVKFSKGHGGITEAEVLNLDDNEDEFPAADDEDDELEVPNVDIKCPKCPSIFNKFVHLKAHLTQVHDEATHVCKYCKRRFKRGPQLKVHLRVHTGEKPYKCSTCNVRFTQGSSLNRHMRKTHQHLIVI